MKQRDLFRHLGFVRLGDYVAERLGVSYRSAQEWMRTDEALGRLPLAAAAFDAGEITSGHVRLLTRVARAENEAYWVGLARRVGVRAFASAVAAGERAEAGARAADGASTSADPDSGGSAAAPDEGPELAPLEIAAPAWLAASWRDSVAFIRQLTGAALSPGECLEHVLAEFGGTEGADLAEGGRADLPQSASSSGQETIGTGTLEREGLPSSAPLDGRGASEDGAGGVGDLPSSAREIDRELRELMAARQSREWNLAESLRGVAMTRSYRVHGFRSMEDYARDRVGISPRPLYRLLALQKTLDRLPLLRRAFLDGRVTMKQVQAVGSVATIVTESAWIERARSVTLRRLEDEVCFWRHLKDVRPAVWAKLDGGPLPEGIVLVPGREPRLHARAGSRAREFIRALEAEERAVPMPDHLVRIRLRVEPGVKAMWDGTVAHCREVVSPAIKEWEVLALALSEFWRTWDNQETRRQRRENPVLERDGWRCVVPGCRAVGSGRLQDHHLTWRSHGGSDEEWNRAGTCTPHHLHGIHAGFIRCSGRAPDDLVWEMGIEPGKEPFLMYRGETLIGGTGV